MADRLEREIAVLDWNLTNHTPTEAGVSDIEHIRALAKTMGSLLVTTCPPGVEYETAKVKLQELVFWSVAAIARVDTEDEPSRTLIDAGFLGGRRA
jgi:hypothetical protein